VRRAARVVRHAERDGRLCSVLCGAQRPGPPTWCSPSATAQCGCRRSARWIERAVRHGCAAGCVGSEVPAAQRWCATVGYRTDRGSSWAPRRTSARQRGSAASPRVVRSAVATATRSCGAVLRCVRGSRRPDGGCASYAWPASRCRRKPSGSAMQSIAAVAEEQSGTRSDGLMPVMVWPVTANILAA
jgi:hypothetical protein